MLKRTSIAVALLMYLLSCGAWECPDLENGQFPDEPYIIYSGRPTGHDKFKRITIAGFGVACLYQKDDPFRGLMLIRYGYFSPLEREAEYWHQVGGGTSAKYCIAGRTICTFH